MNRILTWFLIALLLALSGPVQALSTASARGFEKSLYGRSTPCRDKYAFPTDPINSADPSGLLQDAVDSPSMQRFSDATLHDSRLAQFLVQGGMVVGGAAFSARVAYLAFRGIQAARLGVAGATVFAAEHKDEIAGIVQGAVMPAGHPTIVTPASLTLSKTQFSSAGSGLERISGTISNVEGVAVVEGLTVAGNNVNWRGIFRTLEARSKELGATSIRIEATMMHPNSMKVPAFAEKYWGYKLTPGQSSYGSYPRATLERDL